MNNWNEERKNRREEIKILNNLSTALTSDLENHFAKHPLRTTLDIESINIILDYIRLKRSYHDSLRFHFGVLSATGGKVWTPQLSAYKRLESKGLDLIKNESLLNSILDICNLDYPRISNLFENYLKNIYDYGRPIIRKKFIARHTEEVYDGFTPLDYFALGKNVEFLNTLKVLRDNSRQIHVRLSESQINVENVLLLIKNELAED